MENEVLAEVWKSFLEIKQGIYEYPLTSNPRISEYQDFEFCIRIPAQVTIHFLVSVGISDDNEMLPWQSIDIS